MPCRVLSELRNSRLLSPKHYKETQQYGNKEKTAQSAPKDDEPAVCRLDGNACLEHFYGGAQRILDCRGKPEQDYRKLR